MAVDDSLRRMAPWVEKANRGEFCSGGAGGAGNGPGVTIPSRYQTMTTDSEIVVRK